MGANYARLVIVAFSISPSGGDESGGVSAAVAEAVRVVRASGLPNETNAMFTNIEGEWDDVFAAVKRCHEVVHEMGAPRITTSLKIGTRTDRDQSMQQKVDAVVELRRSRVSNSPP